MLRIDGLIVRYNGMAALDGVSLEISEGSFVSLLGPNGAGKSTLFRAVSGTVCEDCGVISYRGRNLKGVPAFERARSGISLVPEGRRLFESMTVEENLEVGTYASVVKSKRTLDDIYALFPKLFERRGQIARTLSGGEKQMVAIGRGLASVPSLLLLDEPSMGLSPVMVDAIFQAISAIHREMKMTVVLVEQRAVEALDLCEIGYVLKGGRVVLTGQPSELRRDPRLTSAYVGA
ncbi:MAG: ABC transporter ATP-binding protein [Pseudolabrys sp.]|nr:ABC transporter ATP-binding protein [Pseudolabrys sp.]